MRRAFRPPFTMYAVCLLLAALPLHSRAQDFHQNAMGSRNPTGSDLSTDLPASPTAEDQEGEVRFITTAPTLTLLNHHPLLEEFLHETLMRKEHLEQGPFLTGGLDKGVDVNVQPDLVTWGPRGPDVNLAHQDNFPGISEFKGLPWSSPATTIDLETSMLPLIGNTMATETEIASGTVRRSFTTNATPKSELSSMHPSDLPPDSSSASSNTESYSTGAIDFSQAGTQNPSQVLVSAVSRITPTSDQASRGAVSSGLQGQTEAQERNPATYAFTVPSPASSSEDDEDTTTTTITTTVQVPVPCSSNFTGPEGYMESPAHTGEVFYSSVDCTYTVSVYAGYGVEIKVLNISLVDGETITVESMEGVEPAILANESFLMKGQVIRSPTNQVTVHYQSTQPESVGQFHFHYQAYLLSCGFPGRPVYGDVSVTSLHPGGDAYFYCNTGYQLHGLHVITCLNATRPFWSGSEPKCVATCGGVIRNATTGRLMSPGFPSNYSNNLTCHWLLQAADTQRLHLHFEKVSLAEDDDRLIIRNGNNIDAPPVYDSYEVEYLPIEGLVSSGQYFFVELTTDSSGTSIGVALRYEAFERGHCYEPFTKYGNFTTTDGAYPVGTTVEFTCNMGYTLEQGSIIIECVDASDPQWNETEPACRAVCSGEITDSAGVVLSPNWPEAYGTGQDCIWGIHVEEDKRIMMDIQVFHIGKNDILTVYDGDDLTARILGQYMGIQRHFKLYTSMADATIQFQTDPGSSVFGYHQGFVIHFFEVPRNDTCPDLPEIPNGWKTTSQSELIHGTVVTYQCYPGYEVIGAELLMCQWDLTWSGDLPSCLRVTTCPDPGDVDHSRRVISNSNFPVGSTVRFTCDKGYTLTGSSTLTCYNRQAGKPKWSDRIPKCVPEIYEPCRHPGLPQNSVLTPEKRLYQPGESLQYSCQAGFALTGQGGIRCVPGHPSQWSSPPPACKASTPDVFYTNRQDKSVAKSISSENLIEGINILIAIFIPVVIVALIIGGIFLYFSRLQGKTLLRIPLTASQPYDQITVESAFDNPTFESGETREYEVSI
ncbi:seizure protein 6 homolog isoform X2 [Ambystoma mexicanum]|uniref:seizure protein 6 homolog isoform X2 n=1 Tax=Ambystoma mexicanum TaxID=8296 RepID=UPI0037E7A932